jgi:predicted Zn-dependent peptidase
VAAGDADLTTRIETTRLPNGIRVVTETMPWARSVATGFRVGVGARDESDELAGASHFLEHLLFKGTEARTAAQIAEAVDAVGGDMNAHTAREHTSYYTRLPAGQLVLGLDILSDVLLEPAFRPNEIEAERQVILEEIAMDEDSPEDRVFVLLADALFPGHPIGREVAGTRASIEAMTREQIAGFHRRWYRPANLVVSAAGALDHAEVVEGVARRFGDVDGGERPARIAPSAKQKPLVVQRRRMEQVHMAIGVRAISLHDPDRYALDVADHILGGGPSSRLFQTIREERGLAYSVYSFTSEWTDSGELGVYAGTAPGRFDEVAALLQSELDRFAADGPTEAELQLAKGYLEGSLLLDGETSVGNMAAIGRAMLNHDEIVGVDEHIARYRAVTLADVRRVLDRVLGAGARTIAVVGPVTKKDVERTMISAKITS